MAIINKRKPSPISGGNLFDVAIDLEMQEQKNLQSVVSQPTSSQLKPIYAKMREINKKHIEDRTLTAYMLLQLHSNYFSNTCKFETQDTKLWKSILQVTKGAFLYGKAGIYYDTKAKDYMTVAIANIDVDPFGTMEGATVIPLNKCIDSKNGKLDEYKTIELNKEQCENLFVFYWGTGAFSAWWMFYRVCLQQEEALKRMCAVWPSYNMKYTYIVNDLNMTTEEMEAYWDPLNTFQIALEESNFSNRFDTMSEPASTNNQDFIDFYRKAMAEYYSMFGIKVNKDFKKERNVTNEVEASQDAMDTVQEEWLQYFQVFLKELSSQSWCPPISYKGDKEDDIQRTNGTNQSETIIEE